MAYLVQHSGLLDLPRELRDEIYTYLIYAYKEAPQGASCNNEYIAFNTIMFSAHSPDRTLCTLPWTNRQLRHEYIEFVEGLRAAGRIKAELDIIANGFRFWQTWTMLPTCFPPGTAPFDLAVNLRIFSPESFWSNDGWPRQPGDGFRTLKRMLDLLTHDGPSFGYTTEYAKSNKLWVINRLSVNVTFHRQSKPDTWPETARSVFRMLKALAVDGLAAGLMKSVHAHAEYMYKGKLQVFDREWEVSNQYDAAKAELWRSTGFLSATQKTLSEYMYVK